MKTIMVWLALVAALVWLGLAGTHAQDRRADDANKIAIAKKVLDVASIDFAGALATAQQQVPNGTPLVGRVEVNNDRSLFSFYFLEADKILEVELDAKTGEIVTFQERDDLDRIKKFADARLALEGATVTFSQALEISVDRVENGRAFEVEMEMDGDRAIVEVELLTDAGITRVRIDAKDASSVQVR